MLNIYSNLDQKRWKPLIRELFQKTGILTKFKKFPRTYMIKIEIQKNPCRFPEIFKHRDPYICTKDPSYNELPENFRDVFENDFIPLIELNKQQHGKFSYLVCIDNQDFYDAL